jgi:hypothetical protein
MFQGTCCTRDEDVVSTCAISANLDSDFFTLGVLATWFL